MTASRILRNARRRSGLSQRELARRAGVAQSVVARIEIGASNPTVGTLDRLLRACGHHLAAAEVLGEGVDRTLIRHMLRMTPEERVQHGAAASRKLRELREAVKWPNDSTRARRSKR